MNISSFRNVSFGSTKIARPAIKTAGKVGSDMVGFYKRNGLPAPTSKQLNSVVEIAKNFMKKIL